MQVWEEMQEERTWCSKVSIFNGKSTTKTEELVMEKDEVCVSMCYCTKKENNV